MQQITGSQRADTPSRAPQMLELFSHRHIVETGDLLLNARLDSDLCDL